MKSVFQGVDEEGRDGTEPVYPTQVQPAAQRSLTVFPHHVSGEAALFPSLHDASAAFMFDIYITHSSCMACGANCM